MINKEKVIKGLTLCTTINKVNPVETCGKCPYFIKDNEPDVGCIDILMLDALEILKEQEPRVLTLDEVKAAKGSDMYLEMIGYEDGKDYITAITLDGVGTRGVSFYHNVFDFESYNKPTIFGWRCWTARPTDEQRKAVKWDCNEPPKEEAHE